MPQKFNVSKFAKNQLHKSGWIEGKGLGRKEDGISEALKVKIKADNAGVGHDPGEQFTFHWWDHAFRKSAQNINVTEGETGVTVEAFAETEEASVTKRNKKLLKGKLHYGSFVKSGTLQDGRVQKRATDPDCSSSDSECESTKKSRDLTDEELFAACGGRTAHKGARHGLKLSAKLARLQEQEKMDTLHSPSNSNNKPSKKKKKKKRIIEEGEKPVEQSNDHVRSKKKRKCSQDEIELSSVTSTQNFEKDTANNSDKCKKNSSSRKKKKRRTSQCE